MNFLRLLEGGCSAPIGALAYIKDEEVNFKGVLLSPDGTKKIEVTRTEKVGEHYQIAEFAAEFIIERGGKRLIDAIKDSGKETNIYSTKSLTEDQRFLLNDGLVLKVTMLLKLA